jgi:hypothetical protein
MAGKSSEDVLYGDASVAIGVVIKMLSKPPFRVGLQNARSPLRRSQAYARPKGQAPTADVTMGPALLGQKVGSFRVISKNFE